MPHHGPSAGKGSGGVAGAGAAGNVMSALYLGDMHWWTSDEHIRQLCDQIGAPIELRDIAFSEHKVNGKSKGVAFIELRSAERAALVKNWLENNEFQNKKMTAQLSFGGSGRNPFQTLPKEPANRENRGQRHASGPAALGGGAPSSAQSSPGPFPQKPFHQQQQQQSNSYGNQKQPYQQQQPRHSHSHSQTISPPPPSSAMSMPMPFSRGGMNPAMMQMMNMTGFGGAMYGGGAGMMGYPGMNGFGGGYAGGGGAFNPAFYGAAMGMGGMVGGGGEDSDDGSRKRSRMEG
ncbi:hypothetical protein BCR35DRAFT_91184 [Leucosporidium creatinivorum]|uniref:RRM domain-containing protein n=1 Tax=Leucosporidium creatinivorum TaxID=106004 RepID=A0A1Y2F990_9BASI|nr:hypothetical protein BCR35DRAFT_91184 [Leucosporidium creatinivorum]